MKNLIYIVFIFISLNAFLSCTEPYSLNSEYFEENMVIEATITNRLEKQQIKISKSYPLDSLTYQSIIMKLP